jgi:hypothetical protein
VKVHIRFSLLAIFLFSALVGGQSLTEIAKKEKERRKNIEKKGEAAKVLTEFDLQQVNASSPPPTETSSTARTGSQSITERTTIDEDELTDADASTEIPPNAAIRDKIALFEQMVKAHQAEVQEIDKEIAKNEARLEAIQQELIIEGGSGLPTATSNPNRAPSYAGNTVALQKEQQELKDKNQQLQAQKRKSADDLRAKGRRSGIPAGYLRF